jgi:hypothetical protein
VSNWLADPVACAIRMKEKAGTNEGSGCNILAGRSEVTGRSTRLTRSVEGERTFWSWGHVYAVEDKKRGGQRVIRAGGASDGNPNHSVETCELLPEAANALADCLRAAYVQAGSSDCGGQTIMELIWNEMMVVTDRLIGIQDAGLEPEPDDIGAARSLAWVLAVMQNPYLPNVDSVREQVMERWENEDAAKAVAKPQPARPSLAQRRSARRARRA